MQDKRKVLPFSAPFFYSTMCCLSLCLHNPLLLYLRNPNCLFAIDREGKSSYGFGFWGFERESKRENNLRVRVWECNCGIVWWSVVEPSDFSLLLSLPRRIVDAFLLNGMVQSEWSWKLIKDNNWLSLMFCFDPRHTTNGFMQ